MADETETVYPWDVEFWTDPETGYQVRPCPIPACTAVWNGLPWDIGVGEGYEPCWEVFADDHAIHIHPGKRKAEVRFGRILGRKTWRFAHKTVERYRVRENEVDNA